MRQDFAVEPDDQRMRKAAHLMVGSLAGSLALVTCRDPLRTSLTNRLRSLLAQGLDAAMLEQYVQVPTTASAIHTYQYCLYLWPVRVVMQIVTQSDPNMHCKLGIASWHTA